MTPDSQPIQSPGAPSSITRRTLLAGAGAASLVGLAGCANKVDAQSPGTGGSKGAAALSSVSAPIAQGAARDYWISVAKRLATPVLTHLAARTLKKNMPVEERPNAKRANVSHLEAIGRLLCGIAPWLEQDQPEPFVKLAQEALDAATDPASPDYLEFRKYSQPLVDAAFLASGLIRAPKTLWQTLPDRVRNNLIEALKLTRAIRPNQSNWLLFASMVEAALVRLGKQEVDRPRVDEALTKHESWYLGDGTYGDGPKFHWDYYNSFVIQPFLVETVEAFPGEAAWQANYAKIISRATRYASVQEMLISPEGTYPPIGRSIAYRFGAFHHLAFMAWRKQLAKNLSPAQVRCAMTALIRRQIEAPGTFDANGWLTLGFCGHQPRIADSYVSTGSLYLCACALLPLGLPATDPFWSDPDAPWTSVRAYGGEDIPVDHSRD